MEHNPCEFCQMVPDSLPDHQTFYALSVYIKIVRLIGNVGDRAYAMSHAAAAVSGYMSRPRRVP